MLQTVFTNTSVSESRRRGIFVDAGHLREVCRQAGRPIDLPAVIRKLSGTTKDVYTRYYDCLPFLPRDATLSERAAHHAKRTWLNDLSRLPNVRIILGELMIVHDANRATPRISQKCVDTSLAVDIALESPFFTDIALLANDLDHAPAVRAARHHGARVHLFAGGKINQRLAAYCNTVHALDDPEGLTASICA